MSKEFRFFRLAVAGVVVGIGISLLWVMGWNTINKTSESSSTNSFASVLDSLEKDDEQEVGSRISTPEGISHSQQSILNDLDQFKSGFTRDVALHVMLVETNEDALHGLLKQSEHITPTSLRHRTQTAIARRITSFNPITASRLLGAIPIRDQAAFAKGVFREWSVMDLDAALEQATLMSSSIQRVALAAFFHARADLSKHEKLSLGRKLGKEQLAIDLITEETVATLIDDPGSAWNYVISDTLPNWNQLDLLTRIAEHWVEQEGFKALVHINTSVSEFDEHLGIRSIVGQLIQFNPEEAFFAVSNIESLSERLMLQELVVESWADRSPYELLEYLENIPRHLHRIAERRAILAIARWEPAAAALMLSKVSADRDRRTISMTLAMHWSKQDIEAAIEWTLTEPAVQKFRYDLLRQVLPQLVKTDPDRALEIALQQPTPQRDFPLDAWIVASIGYSNIDQAIDMLPRLGEKSKLPAYHSIASMIVRDHDPIRAIELANELPESKRGTLYNFVAHEWARSYPFELLESIDQLPTLSAKSKAAFTLLSYVDRQRGLTSNQLEYARSFLLDEDAKHLDEFLQEERTILGRYVSPYLD